MTAEQLSRTLRAAVEENERLRADRDHWEGRSGQHKRENAALKAEVERLHSQIHDWQKEHNIAEARAEKAEAALAAARPLIEAVEKSIPPNRPAFAGTQNGKKAWEQKVIRAALAYRESKERANG